VVEEFLGGLRKNASFLPTNHEFADPSSFLVLCPSAAGFAPGFEINTFPEPVDVEYPAALTAAADGLWAD
jgi:hypothetical protein